MNLNNPQNQSYWFVLRDDQTNVVLSSNNFPVQTTQVSRCIIDTDGNRQVILKPELTEIPEEALQVEIPTTEPTKYEFIWDRNSIKQLLNVCTDTKYRNINLTKDKQVWGTIALSVGASPEDCFRKYVNLKSSFTRIHNKKLTGKESTWMYYSLCEEAFNKQKSFSTSLESWTDTKIKDLLNVYIENLQRLKESAHNKGIWTDIGNALGVSDMNARCKFRVLKRTYIRILDRCRETGKIIKWPYYAYFQRIFSENSPQKWSHDKIKLLLNSYLVRAHMFNDSRYTKKDLWSEIAMIVGESARNCNKKYRNLKLTYVKLKKWEFKGRGMHKCKWRYFSDFEEIYRNSNESLIRQKGEDTIIQLLNYYIENKYKFLNPLVRNKILWKVIAPKLDMSPYECDKKFRNLKQSYMRLAEDKKRTGKCRNWPYLTYFEQIYDQETVDSNRKVYSIENTEECLAQEVRMVLKDVLLKKNNDTKFKKLIQVSQESNDIQRERNMILQAMLDRYK